LKKSLYGTKQALHCLVCYVGYDIGMLWLVQSHLDYLLFILHKGKTHLYVLRG